MAPAVNGALCTSARSRASAASSRRSLEPLVRHPRARRASPRRGGAPPRACARARARCRATRFPSWARPSCCSQSALRRACREQSALRRACPRSRTVPPAPPQRPRRRGRARRCRRTSGPSAAPPSAARAGGAGAEGGAGAAGGATRGALNYFTLPLGRRGRRWWCLSRAQPRRGWRAPRGACRSRASAACSPESPTRRRLAGGHSAQRPRRSASFAFD